MRNLVLQWRHGRLRRRFKRLGADCQFSEGPMEVDGRVEAGNGCTFGGNTSLRAHRRAHLFLGDRVSLGDYALIHANEEIRVGDDTCIGPYCVLRDLNHWFYTEEHWRVSPPIIKPIIIGNGCYLGPHCYVMPGVTIGNGAVVAPGSVVNRDIGANEVWAGAPTAQFLAHRTDPERRSSLKRHQALLELYGFGKEDQ